MVSLVQADTTTLLSFPGKTAADEESNRLFFTDSNHNGMRVFEIDTGFLSTLKIREKQEGDTTDTDDIFRAKITELPPVKISPEADRLELKFILPRSLKFVPDAPVNLIARSDNPEAVSIGECSGKNPEKPFIFPIEATGGKAVISIYFRVYCCTTGPRQLCFPKEGQLSLPVEVADGGDSVIKVRYEIDN